LGRERFELLSHRRASVSRNGFSSAVAVSVFVVVAGLDGAPMIGPIKIVQSAINATQRNSMGHLGETRSGELKEGITHLA
jgi:hypothetical protein